MQTVNPAATLKSLSKRFLLLLLLPLAMISGLSSAAHAQTFSLTDSQRRAYLEYYAPVIMKRGNGNAGDRGRDWITNFDYDRDGDYSNNAYNFRGEISAFINNSRYNQNIARYDKWKIRPTLYTYLIEYYEGNRKDLVLQYHVYYAATESQARSDKLHDWERVEVRIKGVTGSPGTGEQVDFVVLTNHQRHIVREGTEPDLVQPPFYVPV